MSLIGKVVTSVPKVFNYTRRLVKASPYIMFGEAANAGAKAATAVTKTADMSIAQYLKNVVKAGGKGIEANIAEVKSVTGAGFLKSMWTSIREVPSVIGGSIKAEVEAAKGLGKIWAGVKGLGKGIGQKLPLIGNLMLIAFELPNIFKATIEKGIGQGLIETVKAGARLKQ